MTIVDESKYVSGFMPAPTTTLGDERHDDAVQPGRARPGGHEGVHVRRAMAERAPGGSVEPPAGPDLDEGGGQEDEAIDGLERHGRLRPEHRDHDPDRDADRDAGLDRQLALLPGALRRPRRPGPRRSAGGRVGVGRGPSGGRLEIVAGGLDGPDQVGPARDVGPIPDRRDLGRQVDRRVVDAGRLAQEPLDPMDARGTGHAGDRQRDLDRSIGGRAGRTSVPAGGGGSGRCADILPGSIPRGQRPSRRCGGCTLAPAPGQVRWPRGRRREGRHDRRRGGQRALGTHPRRDGRRRRDRARGPATTEAAFGDSVRRRLGRDPIERAESGGPTAPGRPRRRPSRPTWPASRMRWPACPSRCTG